MATNFNVFPHFDDIQYLDILRTRRHDLSRTATVTNDIQIVYCKINTIKKKNLDILATCYFLLNEHRRKIFNSIFISSAKLS